jgi:hypothetical protein
MDGRVFQPSRVTVDTFELKLPIGLKNKVAKEMLELQKPQRDDCSHDRFDHSDGPRLVFGIMVRDLPANGKESGIFRGESSRPA